MEDIYAAPRKTNSRRTTRKVTPLVSNREYKGFTLNDVVFRVGALKWLDYPSRIGNTLHYRNKPNPQESNDGKN